MSFELTDAVEFIRRRDFRPATRAVLQPNNARYLVIGEWLQLDANYRLDRGGDNANAGGHGTVTDEAAVPSWPYWLERGRYDAQAIAHGRATILWAHSFEARTDVCDTAAGATIALGSPLSVYDITETATGIIRRGLGVNNAGLIVGYCTRVHGVDDINFVRTLT